MRTCALKKSALLTVLCLLATAAAAQTKPVVVFIATGGTIAMKIDPVKHAPVPAICWPPCRRSRSTPPSM